MGELGSNVEIDITNGLWSKALTQVILDCDRGKSLIYRIDRTTKAKLRATDTPREIIYLALRCAREIKSSAATWNKMSLSVLELKKRCVLFWRENAEFTLLSYIKRI